MSKLPLPKFGKFQAIKLMKGVFSVNGSYMVLLSARVKTLEVGSKQEVLCKLVASLEQCVSPMREDTPPRSSTIGLMESVLSKINEVRPPLRLCSIQKTEDSACGFHLSRTQWDPYPWISNVDDASPAEVAGLTIGDFVIEVNGEDILGLRIDEVAHKVRLKSDEVHLLVWKSTAETENKLPAAFNLQKFSGFLQSTLQLIECPICLDVSSVPTFQCVNGHILCRHCRQKTERCPICRVSLADNGRCLLAEKLHRLIRKTLSVKSIPDKIQDKTVTLKNIETKSSFAGCNMVSFYCPWDHSCPQKLFGVKAVFQHLQKCHNGPVIQYTTYNDTVSVSERSQGQVVCIATQYDATFFLQQIPTKEYYLRVLGDATKASQFMFKIETCENAHNVFHQVSSLSEPANETISRKSFFSVPRTNEKLIITVRLNTKSVNSNNIINRE